MKHVIDNTADGRTSFTEVREYVGEEIARKLMFSFGGVSIYIPKPAAMQDGHPLIEALGRSDAEHLASMFQGSRISITLGRQAQYYQNLERCRQRCNEGESASQIALSMQVGERTVRRWFKKLGISPTEKRNNRNLRQTMRRVPMKAVCENAVGESGMNHGGNDDL